MLVFTKNDLKALDDVLTYMVNVGIAEKNQNIVLQCSSVMGKIQNTSIELAEAEIQLLAACAIRYSRDIPGLIAVNPNYKPHAPELLQSMEYIKDILLPKFGSFFGDNLVIPASITVIRDASFVATLVPCPIFLNEVQVAIVKNGESVTIPVIAKHNILRTNTAGLFGPHKKAKYEFEARDGAKGEIHLSAGLFRKETAVWA